MKNKINRLLRQYGFLLVGLVLYLVLPQIWQWLQSFLPVGGMATIYGVLEPVWIVTMAATLVAFGLRTVISSVLIRPWRRLLTLGNWWLTIVLLYLSAAVWSLLLWGAESYYFWAVALAPLVYVVFSVWDDFKSSSREQLLHRLTEARQTAQGNHWGQFFFYSNRLVALCQPLAVFAYLIYYRWQNADYLLSSWLVNLVVLIVVLADVWTTWVAFRAFQLLLWSKAKEKKTVYKVFPAYRHEDFGFVSLRALSEALEAMDRAIWPEHQRAGYGSIFARLITSPATTFVLVRQDDDRWQVVGALFSRAIATENYFPAGQTRYRVAWSDLEQGGNFSPEPTADCLYVIGDMVLEGEERGAGGLLMAALGKYVGRTGFKKVLGGSRLTDAARYYAALKPAGLSRVDFLKKYIWLRDNKGWPIDETLTKLIRSASVVIGGRKIAQLPVVRAVIFDYFDDPESLDAAALIEYLNPLWWLPNFLKPLWGKVLKTLLMS